MKINHIKLSQQTLLITTISSAEVEEFFSKAVTCSSSSDTYLTILHAYFYNLTVDSFVTTVYLIICYHALNTLKKYLPFTLGMSIFFFSRCLGLFPCASCLSQYFRS